MLASKSPFESYKSKQILFCTYLICPPVSCPIFNFSEKLQNIFEMGSKKNRVKKKLKKIENEKFAHTVLMCPNLSLNEQISYNL